MLCLTYSPDAIAITMPMLKPCEQAPTLRATFDSGHARAYFGRALTRGRGARKSKPASSVTTVVEYAKGGDAAISKRKPRKRIDRKPRVSSGSHVRQLDVNLVDDLAQEAALRHLTMQSKGNYLYTTGLACNRVLMRHYSAMRRDGLAERDARLIYSRLSRTQAYRVLCLSVRDVQEDMRGKILVCIVEMLGVDGMKRRDVRKALGLSKSTMRACILKLQAYFLDTQELAFSTRKPRPMVPTCPTQ